MDEVVRRILSGMAAWHDLATWLKAGDPAGSTDRCNITYPYGGLTKIEPEFGFEGIDNPPGRMYEVRFYWSRPGSDADFDLAFGTDVPNLERYCARLTANAITGWQHLTGYDHPYDGRVYVRQFRFGEPDIGHDVTLTIIAVYRKEA